MSLECKGAYIMLLNLIYTRGGPVEDEPGYIARYIGCSLRKWQKLRLELIALGKIDVENGLIRNSRADEVLLKQRSYQDQQRENRTKPSKNKDQEKRSSHLPKPEPKPDTERGGSVVARARETFDFDALQADCRSWADGALNLTVASAHDLSPITRLLSPSSGEPCTLDDVRNGITRAAAGLKAKGQTVTTFAYFEKPILRERDLRLTPLPAVETTHAVSGSGGHEPRNFRSPARREHRSSSLSTSAARLRLLSQAENDLPD